MAIFGKKIDESDGATRPEETEVKTKMAKPETNEINALLGVGSEFEGKLTFRGTVKIDGRFKGEIFSDATLIIGEGANVEAEIDIGSLVVQGTVTGNVRAKELVKLVAPAKFNGQIHSPNLIIEKGCIFDGAAHMQRREEPRKPKSREEKAAEERPAPVAAVAARPAARAD